MEPTISAPDHLLMESITFRKRKPQRGDIVVFRADSIAFLPPGQLYIKRIVGEPNERVRISDGNVYINDKLVSVSNAIGEISYSMPERFQALAPYTNLTVPPDHYFMLGDNATNSADSRFWGCLPASNVIGRICFCYWPPRRMGAIK